MSYILEALRKSERERQLGQTPALADVVLEGAVPTPRRGGLWLAVAGVLLLVNGGMLFYVWYGPRDAVPLAIPVPAPSSQTEGQPEQASKEEMSRKLIELESRIAQMDASKDAPSESESINADAGKGTAIAAEPTIQPDSLKKPEEVQHKIAAQPNRKMAKKREKVPSDDANSILRDPAPEEHSEEFASQDDDMPDRIRSKINEMKINMLAYSSQPEERFVIVDMVKYLEGERLPNGAELLEIRADSVVVQFDGVKYRVPNQ